MKRSPAGQRLAPLPLALVAAASAVAAAGCQSADEIGRLSELIPQEAPAATTPPVAPPAPVAVDDGSVATSFRSSPMISWVPGTGASASTAYEVAIGTSPGAADVLDWASVGSGSAAQVAIDRLRFDVTYFASVRALSEAGLPGAAVAGDGFNLECPANYVRVPRNPDYVPEDFCVAKYEAKESGGIAASASGGEPWTGVSRDAAVAACAANGAGYALINNSEWQTVARDLEGVGWNWGDAGDQRAMSRGLANNVNGPQEAADDGHPCHLAAAGSGLPSSGGAAICDLSTFHHNRRVLKLSTGAYLWDVAGNATEWVSDDSTEDFGPNSWMRNAASSAAKAAFGPATAYAPGPASPPGSNFMLGLGYLSVMANEGTINRGGGSGYGRFSGVFTVYRNMSPDSAGTPDLGFRCVLRP